MYNLVSIMELYGVFLFGGRIKVPNGDGIILVIQEKNEQNQKIM
jgi:hypothetical protein